MVRTTATGLITTTGRAAAILLLCLLCLPLGAQNSRKSVKLSGDILMAAIPIGAGMTTLIKKDYTGLKQLVLSEATAFGVTYALKFAVCKERPDGSNRYSFPSFHSAASFSGATFLQRRYGWKFGVPAYLLSSYVAWSRVYARKHDWWDVSAGVAIGIGASLIYSRPFASRHNLTICPVMIGERPGLYASIRF